MVRIKKNAGVGLLTAMVIILVTAPAYPKERQKAPAQKTVDRALKTLQNLNNDRI